MILGLNNVLRYPSTNQAQTQTSAGARVEVLKSENLREKRGPDDDNPRLADKSGL